MAFPWVFHSGLWNKTYVNFLGFCFAPSPKRELFEEVCPHPLKGSYSKCLISSKSFFHVEIIHLNSEIFLPNN